MRILLALMVCSTCAAPAQDELARGLMPLPAGLIQHTGALVINAEFSISLAHCSDPVAAGAAERLRRNLCAKTGIPISAGSAASSAPTLDVQCGRAAADESYTLRIAPAHAELQAVGPLGVLRGMATILQLAGPAPVGFAIPAVEISDRPRFPWRGLMIDVARHFVSTATLKRQIDAMEAVKLNVLHLHLSDAQAFRVESRVYPKLHELGSGGEYYTQDEVRDLVSYARDRGIRVLPEFDVPGHSKSWLVAYPALASRDMRYKLGEDAEARHATLDPTRKETYGFLDALFGEMSALFPDRCFHIGGDEVSGRDWTANPSIQAFMKQKGIRTNRELQGLFTNRVHDILTRHGKTMVAWDEVLHPGLPRDVVVQSWRGSRMQALSAIDGHETLVSAGYYLDWLLPAEFHYGIDPLDTTGWGVTEKELQPVRNSSLGAVFGEAVIDQPTPMNAEQQSRIRGGEAAIWSEIVTDEIVETRVWPRAAAIAERLWSPASVQDIDSMYRRLAILDSDLEMLGLRHRQNSRRMLERLWPADPEPLHVLASALGPVRFYGRLLARSRAGNAEAPLNGFADAIPPESLPACEFNEMVKRMFENGDTAPAIRPAVRARLLAWQRNHAAVTEIGKRSAAIAPLVPLSADLTELSAAALASLDALEAGTKLDAAWKQQQFALVAKYQQAAAASATMLASFRNPQPPTGLLIAVLPGIAQIIAAAPVR